jgi:hypothetical protein
MEAEMTKADAEADARRRIGRERERGRASSFTGSMTSNLVVTSNLHATSPATAALTVDASGFATTLTESAAGRAPALLTLLDTATPTANEQTFYAIQSFYLSHNRPRDRQIADRITTLFRDALAEDSQILPASLAQFTAFFLNNAELKLPKITLTPDGTLRARWIHSSEDFIAVEFKGGKIVRLVAEVPRTGGETASYFATEPVNTVVKAGQAIGATFG